MWLKILALISALRSGNAELIITAILELIRGANVANSTGGPDELTKIEEALKAAMPKKC
jgi:hypothetical protein